MALAQFPMGPASFAWPVPRLWDRAADKIPPCGSLEHSGNRSKFPMDPKSVADFTPFMSAGPLPKLGVGMSCISVPDAFSFVEAGDRATLQLRYFSDYDTPTNQSFFACADITYVDPSDILFPFPCLNTTAPDPDLDKKPVSQTPTGTKPKGRTKFTEEPEPTGDGWSPGKRTGLSKAAIAGISIGSAVPVTGVMVGIWLLVHRRKERRADAERRKEEAEWQSQRASQPAPDVRL
ncbi:wsc2 glucoamylase iii alpha-1 [Trichoderma cornu-damae]|uniref:Wsc2 glucoamylase iii alpha-1 n=1 Tax=Trichoderma cornu-damae TaxID=654480 RepID=A0A9P8U0V6_9HYPO|nr:wsc2 glucoamylase iii alpha-1 [Trichoderma cornu-damae]